MKKLFAAVFVLIVLLCLSVPAVAVQSADVEIDGVPLATDVAPRIVSGRMLVPVRAIAEALGCQVDFRSGHITLTAADGSIVCFELNSKYMTAEREGVVVRTEMEAAPRLVNNRTLVPLRFFAEALGCAVDYFSDTGKVLITAGATAYKDGVSINSMTEQSYVLVARSLIAYTDQTVVNELYRLLRDGRLKELAAPDPKYYGRLNALGIDNFFTVTGEYRFYHGLYDTEQPGVVNYILYGSPMPPEDYPSLLLYDIDADKWYEFDRTKRDKLMAIKAEAPRIVLTEGHMP